jgi:glutamyl-Q tRNA(Asp) synthetase
MSLPQGTPKTEYVGRFAPSPTGDLHFGSLIAAVGSFLQARTHSGRWLVRIEDIDPPREVAGSAERILQDLARLRMEPDEPALYQSRRLPAYRDAWQKLVREKKAYHCRCSRKMLPPSGIYPGTCRELGLSGDSYRQIRFRVGRQRLKFCDAVMGPISQDLSKNIGDFVIRRTDGLPAYQLAVVVDDAWQKITQVVRGADLLDSTPRQIALQCALDLPTPDYCHLPLAVLPDGRKLSKQLGSDPVHAAQPEDALAQALTFLGHEPPIGLTLDRLWDWAMSHWDLQRVPRQQHLPLPAGMLPR